MRPTPTPALVREPELVTPDTQNVQVASLGLLTTLRRRQTAVTSVVTLPLQLIAAGTTTWPLPGRLALAQPGTGTARAARVTAVYLQGTYTSTSAALTINGVAQVLPTTLTDDEVFFATDIPLDSATPTLVLTAPGLVLTSGWLTLHIEVDRLTGVSLEPVQQPSTTDLSPFVALDLTEGNAAAVQDETYDSAPGLLFFDSIRDVVAGAPMTLFSPSSPDPLTGTQRQVPGQRPQAVIGGYLGSAIAGTASVALATPAGTLATASLLPATPRATATLVGVNLTGAPLTAAEDWSVVFTTSTTSRRFVGWVVVG